MWTLFLHLLIVYEVLALTTGLVLAIVQSVLITVWR